MAFQGSLVTPLIMMLILSNSTLIYNAAQNCVQMSAFLAVGIIQLILLVAILVILTTYIIVCKCKIHSSGM